MTTECFMREHFEMALPNHRDTGERLWTSLGLEEGEYSYLIPITDDVSIKVRSSVDSTGYAKPAGEDSIRAWLVGIDGKPLGSKIQAYVTRAPGWNTRMLEVLRELARRAKRIDHCPCCGKPMGIFKVKKEGANKGRLFLSCSDACKQFKWVS